MNRRDVIKYATILTGGALASPLIVSLSSCKTDPKTLSSTFEPTFFNSNEFDLVKTLVDIIIPETDSPSATAVGVHQTIDEMVKNVYTEEDRTTYAQNFNALLSHLNADTDETGFMALSEDAQIAKIQALEARPFDEIKTGYSNIKQQAVAYYLSTEEIGTNFLNYVRVPGEYEACVSLESVGGKKWAL